MTEIKVATDAAQLAQTAAEFIVEQARKAIADHQRFSIALSGGSTPKALYQLLAQPLYHAQIDWSNVFVFWGDERCVPPDHADSSYRMARETLLDSVPVPLAHVFRVRGEADPAEAASEYERLLQDFFADSEPRVDVILLGMGDDGHMASLFPGTTALDETVRWVVPNYVEAKQMWRVTFTIRTINAAANVVFLVSGSAKAERLRQVLFGTFDPHRLPAQMAKPINGNLFWMVDRDAAALLNLK